MLTQHPDTADNTKQDVLILEQPAAGLHLLHDKRFIDYTQNNKVQLVKGGRDFFAKLLQMINDAKETIHLQVYIFDDDETGRQIGDALIKAAQRGVQVYLLVDGYASQVLAKSYINQLKKAGIHFRFFEPVYKSRYFYFGRRLHHKLIVVDTMYTMVGGVNITNRYNDMPGKKAWLDFALFAEGEIARQICILCWKTWQGFPPDMGVTPCEAAGFSFDIPPQEASLVRMRRNDWVRGKNQISKSYIEMLHSAESKLTILCSYFLPGRVISRNLAKAVKRGVKVKVILAGLSDVMLAKYAEKYIYKWLLNNGIEIYEYQESIVHGKIAVCDGKWLTIGSYNVNNISAYASIELNLDVYNPKFAVETENMLDSIIREKCVQVNEKDFYRSSNIFKKFVRWFSFQFIRTVFYLFTFYFKRQH